MLIPLLQGRPGPRRNQRSTTNRNRRNKRGGKK